MATERDMESVLTVLLEDHLAEAMEDELGMSPGKVRVRTFESEGVLTTDRGLVIRMGDAEYFLTIQQTRAASGADEEDGE